MVDTIALDLLLLRLMARGLKAARGLNSDLVGLVDDWGRGFVDELDYTREAANSEAFLASLEGSPLAGVVTAPEVLQPLSYATRRLQPWTIASSSPAPLNLWSSPLSCVMAGGWRAKRRR